MRALILSVRLVLAAAGLLAPWLLLASAVVDASPPRHKAVRWGRLICDPHTPSRRALSRIVSPPTTRRTILRDVAALVQRSGPKAPHGDDDEAIQNDPAAVGVEECRRMTAPLEPLGVLVFSHSPLRNPWTFSPRAPRGPPAFS